MNEQKMNLTGRVKPGHNYVCRNLITKEILRDPKLPPILKILRERTNYTFKIPHGNKVRTLILEEGVCRIEYPGIHYEITIERI